ncbi:hypothetical protein H0X06_02050 [Candidatus Dependentiae bacterium]|nr:hypothetical protein [Candidatus Dependentiae bacterium]
MNKVFSLTVLLLIPFVIHTMETEPVDPNVFKTIQKSNPYLDYIKKSQSSDGTKIVTLTEGGTVSLWEGKTGELLEPSVAKGKQKVQSVGFNPESTKVIIKTLQGTEEYDITDFVRVDPNVFKIIQKKNPYVDYIKKSQSPDGTKIVTLAEGGTVSLWNGKTGELLEPSVAKNKQKVQSVGFNPDGTKVIIKTLQGTEEYDITDFVRVDPTVFKIIQKKNPYVDYIKKSQSPDGTKIVTLTEGGTVSLWEGKTGKTLKSSLAENKNKVQSIGFNPEGTKVLIKIPLKGTEEYPI